MLTEQDFHNALVIRHPFWMTLSPSTIKQRIDQILSMPDSQAAVQALSAVEYTILLKTSPETRPVLLELAHAKQIRTVMDLDCWDKDNLKTLQVITWLEELRCSGDDVLTNTLMTLDTELLIAAFRNHIRIHAALPFEEEDEPVSYDEIIANELYRIEFLDQESMVNEHIQRLFSSLRRSNLDFYYNLMQNIMWGQDSEAETWAYRWKSGRLQDEGFPDYYDALETYRLVDLEHPLPSLTEALAAPGIPEGIEESGIIPSYTWGLTPSGFLFDHACIGDLSSETQERLCWEMVYLCNRELVINQVDFTYTQAVHTSLSRVHAYLNLGIEYLKGNDVQQLPSLLTSNSLQSIFDVGFTLSMRLHRQALHIQRHLNHAAGIRRALPGLTRQVLDGLLLRTPQFFVGLESPGAIGYRSFLHLQDLMLITPILTSIEQNPAYHTAQQSP
jgi:hypothetical protein